MSAVELPLVVQTSYAELADLLKLDRLTGFAPGSTFRERTISGKTYWYAQAPTTPAGRPRERYVGADTPELRATIERARAAKASADTRKTLCRSLIAAGLPQPDRVTAAVVDALAEAGVFRLRGVIVGTVAFQTYAGLLGVKLPGTAVRTADLDLAQDYCVSLALDVAIDRPLIEVLQTVDPSFSAVPSLASPTVATTFARPDGFRVDVLTTNRGEERDVPSRLPSLQSDAVPLRFLDYLLRETVEAAVLTRAGALVNVPAPERFAVHKLIVAARRRQEGESAAKSDKDILHAATLIDVLTLTRRGDELSTALAEALERGPTWRELIEHSVPRLAPSARATIEALL